MRMSKFFPSNYTLSKNPTTLKVHSFHLSSRAKSYSNKRHSCKTSRSKETQVKSSPPSLLQRITELVGTEYDQPFSFSKHASLNKSRTQLGTPTVCQNPDESSSVENLDESMFRNQESEETHVGNSNLEDLYPVIRKVTEVLRSENARMPIDQRLEEMGITLTSEIVERVLKNCFKVGHLALTFFNWVKLQPGYSHTIETYNAMIYIAGEAEDFDLVDKLVGKMEEEACVKNIKTWTILISHYGKAKKISRALSTFEEMRRSRCIPDSGVYEAIIRALVTAEKAELALEFYKEMISKNIEVVSIYIYELLMNCLSSSGDVAAARSVGHDMIKSMKVSESEGYTRTLKSFCISGRINEAQALLEEMNTKNIAIDSKACEVLLKGLCRASRMDEATEIVDNMKQHLEIDGKIYGFLIDGLLRNGNMSKALELFHGMRELKCVPTVSTYTQLIQHLFRSNEYKKALEIYAEMVEDGIKADAVAITAMVAGHVQHNHISEAWELFESMKKNGVNPTPKAYSVFIKELCKASKPNETLKLLKDMIASNLNVSDNIFGFVIASLIEVGEVEKAKIVKEMSKFFKIGSSLRNKRVVYQSHDDPPVHQVRVQDDSKAMQKPKEYNDRDLKELCRILSSSTDWNSMEEVLERSNVHFTTDLVSAVLSNCQKNGRVALSFFAWLGKKDSYRHTSDTYNLAIKISGSAKDFKHMRDLYREMRRNGCSITPNTWTIMIAQYGQAGLTDIALKTFKEMKQEGFQPNGSTYKYLIVFLCGKKGRNLEEAIKIFQAMTNAGFMPDKETVATYLSSLCESKKLVEARKCVNHLFKKGFAKQLGYSLLVKSMCRAGELEAAVITTKELEHDGCTMDEFIYGSIVHALLREGRVNEALDKVEEMKSAGISESVHIQTSFLVYFWKEREVGKALDMFEKMKRNGFEPTLVTYSVMIRGYMNHGMVSDAWDVFRRMKVKGPIPDFETYSMFISCLCKVGKSEDGLQLIQEMMEKEIIPSAVNFRMVFHGLNREGKQGLAHNVLQTKWNLKRQRMFSY